MAGPDYKLIKSQLTQFLNDEYPNGGITIDQLNAFRNPAPERAYPTNGDIMPSYYYATKTQVAGYTGVKL